MQIQRLQQGKHIVPSSLASMGEWQTTVTFLKKKIALTWTRTTVTKRTVSSEETIMITADVYLLCCLQRCKMEPTSSPKTLLWGRYWVEVQCICCRLFLHGGLNLQTMCAESITHFWLLLCHFVFLILAPRASETNFLPANFLLGWVWSDNQFSQLYS